MDFTYSSYRITSNTTWSPRGNKQPKKRIGYTRYTNCFVTACWANENKSVCMYTYNPQFKTIQSWKESVTTSGNPCQITPRRRAAYEKYMKFLKEFNLDQNLITFLNCEGKTYGWE